MGAANSSHPTPIDVFAENAVYRLIEADEVGLAVQAMLVAGKRLSDPSQLLRFCDLSIDLGRRRAAQSFLARAQRALGPGRSLALLEAKFEVHFGDPCRALALCQQVLQHFQTHLLARNLRALAFFRLGMLDAALSDYEARIDLLPSYYYLNEHFRAKRWTLGRDLGRHVCIWREQGVGDELVFLNGLRQSDLHGRELTICTDKSLRTLLAKAFADHEVLATGDARALARVEAADTVVYAGSLPLLARQGSERRLANVPVEFAPDETRPRRRLGVAWRSTSARNDARRRINHRHFLHAIAAWQGEVVNVQPVVVEAEEAAMARQFGRAYLGQHPSARVGVSKDEFADQLRQCSLVVGVNTTVCFLSHFLGIPTVLLLPDGSDPRWAYAGDDGLLPGMVRVIGSELVRRPDALTAVLRPHLG